MYYGWLSLKRSERCVFLLHIFVMVISSAHSSTLILLSWMGKEMKISFMRETSLAEWHSEGQVDSIHIISKMAVYKNKGRQQALGTAKLQSDGGRKQLSIYRHLAWLSVRNDSHGGQPGVPGGGYKPQCHATTVKLGGVSWWSGDAPSSLGSGQLSSHARSFLEENLLSSEGWFLQWDNAPRHTALSIKMWMKDHHVRTLSLPAQSSDLTPNHTKKLWQTKFSGIFNF